jgi:methylated-DNA-[protein]-cysteine S-methyltransferase
MNTITFASPLGVLRLYAAADALVAVHLPDQDAPAARVGANAVLRATAAQLDEYFAGKRRTFELPLAPRGTGFQERVGRALTQIPFGETRSYSAIARAIGRPSASRAVGAANGTNPIAIIVPCHRVIGASGALTGYAGGLATKRWLLEHELRHSGQAQLAFAT